MSKITQFNPATCRAMSMEIATALADICGKYGLAVKLSGGKYTATSYSPKLELAIIAPDGAVLDINANAFRQLATAYGLLPEHFGATFMQGGKTFKICGLKSRAGRLPILASEVNSGKVYKFNEKDVARALGLTVAPSIAATWNKPT